MDVVDVVVHQHHDPATCMEDYDFVSRMSKEEKWSAGPDMISQIGAIAKPGLFIASLNGQRIGCVCTNKFRGEGDDEFCYIGFYVVDKPFRGKGYGLKLWNVMWESLGKDWNIVLDAVPDMVPRYERMGLCPMWDNKKYFISCSKIIQTSLIPCDQSTTLINIKTEPIDQVDFDKLLAYDTSVFGFPRREFLQKWITIPNSLGLAVTNKDGDIIGYAVMQYSVFEKQQIVGPFFSDDNNVTRLLLSSLAKAAIDIKGAECLRLSVPVGVNPSAAEIIEKEIGYDSFVKFSRMYSKGIPPHCCMTKVMALTSTVLSI